MKNKMRTQRRNKLVQRSKMVAVMAAIFFVLGGITPTNVVSVKATSLDSDVANDDFNEGTAVTGGTCRIIGEDGSYEVLLYCDGKFLGSYIMHSPGTLATASRGTNGDQRLAFKNMYNTKWKDSGGKPLRLNGNIPDYTYDPGSIRPASDPHGKYYPDCPTYTDTTAIKRWLTNANTLEKKVFSQIYKAEQVQGTKRFSKELKDALIQQVREMTSENPPNKSEIQDKLATGEYHNFMIMMRPYMLYFVESAPVIGELNGYKTRTFYYSNREQHFNKWRATTFHFNSMLCFFYFRGLLQYYYSMAIAEQTVTG